MKLFLACAPGLEAVVAAEAAALGLTGRAVEGGVEAEGDPVIANRWLRCATRVWARVGEAGRPEELGRVSLDAYRKRGTPISLDCPPRWQSAATRAWGASTRHGLEVMIREDAQGRGEVSVDSSGELLHMRGYRQEVGKAPLRETLAAGVLLLGGYSGKEPLWDVMCGSGTLLIEAAWIALGIAPGSLRHFAFESWPSWKETAAPPKPVGKAPPLLGSDLNAGQLGVARRNARRAGVLEHLVLDRMDATKLTVRPGSPALPASPGLVVANLPYGIRVGEKSELGALYAAVGASVKKVVPGWRFAFLLQEGEEALGLTLTASHEVNNGGIRCRVVTGTV